MIHDKSKLRAQVHVFVRKLLQRLRQLDLGAVHAGDREDARKERAGAVSAHKGRGQVAQRIRPDSSMQGGPRRAGQARVAAQLSPEDVPRKLYSCVRSRLFQNGAARVVCQGAPDDPGSERVGQSVAGDPDFDPAQARPQPAPTQLPSWSRASTPVEGLHIPRSKTWRLPRTIL